MPSAAESDLRQIGLSAAQATQLWQHAAAISAAAHMGSSSAAVAVGGKAKPPPPSPARTEAPPPLPAPAPKPKPSKPKHSPPDAATLALDIGRWLAKCQTVDCEKTMRENMIERVEDLCFMVRSATDPSFALDIRL